MLPPVNLRSPSALPLVRRTRGLVRWVSTNNPFYVISAGLFLAGLRLSFAGPETGNWGMMSGLAGYTMLLASTALFLVRWAGVWDDVRTVLLLVVLMFLATSVTFDRVLALDRTEGFRLFVGGLLLAVVVTEGLLRGIHLRLPAAFRVPYYFILGLFFLYPLGLAPLLFEPESEEMMWGLFGFASVAGLAFLTLLPAARRGREYLRDNGSPWPWPLYPWALFGVLALAVPARAVLLCWSLHRVEAADFDHLIFAPFFLVPFGFAVAIVLLEIGLASAPRLCRWVVVAAPALLVGLTLIGHEPDPLHDRFLQMFRDRLGGTPTYVTVLATIAFLSYALLRRVPGSLDGLTAAVAALSFVGPDTDGFDGLRTAYLLPLAVAAAMQLAVGVRNRDMVRSTLGSAGLVLAATWAVPGGPEADPLRQVLLFHLALVLLLALGAFFSNVVAQLFRFGGAMLVLATCWAVAFTDLRGPWVVPAWVVWAYSFALAAGLAGYALLLRNRFTLVVAAVACSGWLAAAAWHGYRALRREVVGLDYLTLSLALFGLAVTISLAKSGALARMRRRRADPATESAG